MIRTNDMIIAKGRYYDMDCHKTQLNNNVLVVGGSGCGKTRGVVIPNILQATGSYIISDPKGNLYDRYANYLWERGYVVKKLDFTHPENSVGYNFFEYINNEQDVLKVATMLTYADGSNNCGNLDPFWDETSCILFQALIAFLRFHRPLEDGNLASVYKLLMAAQIDENNVADKTPLDIIFEELRDNCGDEFAVKQYFKFRSASGKTLRSIIITAFSKLGMFDTPALARMMSNDEIDAESIGQRKTAIFVVVSDTDRSMDTLVNLFFTQMMNELCNYADTRCPDQSLPVHVRFILDDFATNCRIEQFPRMISSIRSRNISTMLMIQAESQLEAGYQKDSRTIIANCDTYAYFGGNDIDTAEAVAKRSDQPFQDIINMPIGKCWIFRRGERPVDAQIFKPEDYQSELYKADIAAENKPVAENRRKDFRITGFSPVNHRGIA